MEDFTSKHPHSKSYTHLEVGEGEECVKRLSKYAYFMQKLEPNL